MMNNLRCTHVGAPLSFPIVGETLTTIVAYKQKLNIF